MSIQHSTQVFYDPKSLTSSSPCSTKIVQSPTQFSPESYSQSSRSFQLGGTCFTVEDHPLIVALLQSSSAASKTVSMYLLSAIWTAVQSLAWIALVQGLVWIQTLGPMIMHWDSFLLGAVFLTMTINLDVLDERLYPNLVPKRQQPKSQPIPSASTVQQQFHQNPGFGSPSRSSSNGSKKVTFDEQVMVLGTAAQQGVTPISTVGINCFDAFVPLSESPTGLSTVFNFSSLDRQVEATVLLKQMQREERAQYPHMARSYVGPPTIIFESPSSSRSSSCQSSIRSVSSDSSDRESNRPSRSTSARLAALFHPHSADNNQSHGCSSNNNSNSRKLVRRIIKRQINQRQAGEKMSMADPVTTISLSDSEYQPVQHQRKTLAQRLGLKKIKKSL
ncbi:hypothetical protein BX616_006050 [Lobosporangium transversale]|uniref:Transmembrane protein n=1 Tax=Lobosporangium transversale TaxID=64571 RepID=A0A1Y2G681_9FUNG|nr:hypothetical protein BCR41DRAFT_365699 [Lobosporangium transversale]KAF9915484.1 hypothetical protein BX616_006050 [Lobosporangium transversale]ORY93662.1 hypothetical protein BCR41DRAFT_365699 [Lobosporangium transversale]|eukprot:XP_021875157.1 hypothetical protein BCR41DRAFT_365699 [Lobosporangium transversale]